MQLSAGKRLSGSPQLGGRRTTQHAAVVVRCAAFGSGGDGGPSNGRRQAVLLGLGACAAVVANAAPALALVRPTNKEVDNDTSPYIQGALRGVVAMAAAACARRCRQLARLHVHVSACSSWGASGQAPCRARAHARSPRGRPLKQRWTAELLRRTEEKREERKAERLNDYYKRNFREYFEVGCIAGPQGCF